MGVSGVKRQRIITETRPTVAAFIFYLHLLKSHTLKGFYEGNSDKLPQLSQKSTVTRDQYCHGQIVIRDNHDD